MEIRSATGRVSHYTLSHVITHLLLTDQDPELVALLEDLVYLEQRVTAGQVYELLEDFQRTLNKIPKSQNVKHLHAILLTIRRELLLYLVTQAVYFNVFGTHALGAMHLTE
jgi:hypothetical protein